MGDIKAMLKEVKFEMFKIVFLSAFLDSSIFFLITYLLLSVFSIGMIFPLIASATYLGIRTYLDLKKVSLETVEKNNPEIREMLRTANDNQNADSFMAHALFNEVIKKMKKISSGTFISLKQITKKLAVIFIISSLLFTMAFFNINISKFENPFKDINLNFDFKKDKQNAAEEDIALVTLGSGDVDISLKQNLNQIDFNDVSQAQDTGLLRSEAQGEVNAQASKAYTNSLDDLTDRKTAAEYSQKIKN